MSEACSVVIIDVPKDKAWDRLRDLSLAHYYVPGIVRTEITTDQKQGVGASRKVFQAKGGYLDETVTEWDEGSGFRIRLHKGPKDTPFKNAYFRYQLDSTADNKTRFTATMGYTPPLGAIGSVIDTLLLNRIISSVIRDIALSMKVFYETGKPTTKAQLKKVKKTAVTFDE